MRVRIMLQITGDDGISGAVEEVAAFDKETERPEQVGLSLAEGKSLLAAVQHEIVQTQVESWTDRHRCCVDCGFRRRSKGNYAALFRTLYGDVELASPRLHRCPCQPDTAPASTSPLHDLLPDHVAPERLYLETRWASLVSYAAAAGLLADVLPIASGANATTVREHTLRIVKRADAELEHLTPQDARQQFAAQDAAKIIARGVGLAEAPTPVGKVVDGMTIPGQGGTEIPIRIYYPKATGIFPVIVYYHGGGFVVATIDTYDESARSLCVDANAIVVSVEYRKAPEAPFPAARQDAIDAYRWVTNNIAAYDGLSNEVAVAGESAGGNLAAEVSIAARKWY